MNTLSTKSGKWINILCYALLVIGGMLYQAQPAQAATPTIYYVKEGGAGTKDGTSWANAFDTLQKALNKTDAAYQIWIAAGTYSPDNNTSFSMKNNVAIYGGFPHNKPNANMGDRDITTNKTILKGNGASVIQNGGVTNTAILDGVIVTGGNNSNYGGGGIYNQNSSPTLTNVTISGNNADKGGGIYNQNSSPTLTNVMISGNTANYGGGMYNWISSSPTLTNVTISGNKANFGGGGGMYNLNGNSPIVSKSIIWGNSSEVLNLTSTPTFSKSLIQGSGGSDGWNAAYGTDSGCNLDGNPLFVDTTNGDYRIWTDSPAVFATYYMGAYPGIPGYKVTYDGNGFTGGDVPDTTMYVNGTAFTVMDNVKSLTRDGHSFIGWTSILADTSIIDYVVGEQYTISGKDIILYAKWINTYTLTYNAGLGGSISDPTPQVIKHGENGIVVTAIPDTGYHFVDWSDGMKTPDRTDVNVTGNVTVDANFAINEYTVTFKDHDGTTLTTEKVEHGNAASAPSNLSRTGYTFTGWDKAFTNITTDVVVTANYDINKYILTFDSKEGSTIDPITTNCNTAITAPNLPTKTGYTFGGWFKDELFNTVWDFETDKVTSDTTLYAKWTLNTYTLTYTAGSNGNISGPAPQVIKHGDNGTVVTAIPDTGYHFVDWSDGLKTPIRTDVNITENITLNANFAINKYTVTFNDHDGTTLTTVKVEHGSAASAPINPSRTGYTFTGWDKAFTNITKDVVVTANYDINKYTLTFDSKAGSAVSPIMSNYNTSATAPDHPIKTGHSFEGWYKEETLDTVWDFTADKVTENTTLYAKWIINPYSLTFNSNDGSAVDPITTNFETTVEAPDEPTKTGYTFGGWYKEEALDTVWDFGTDKVLEDTTLYAKWTINTYTISFESNGGTIVDPQSIIHDETIAIPDQPTKAGNIFVGWYTDATLTKEWGFVTDKVETDRTLYAKWRVRPTPPPLPVPTPEPEPEPEPVKGPVVQTPEFIQATVKDGKIQIQVKDPATGEWKQAQVERTQTSGRFLIIQTGSNGESIETDGIEFPQEVSQIVVLNNDQPYTYFDINLNTKPTKTWEVKFSAALLNSPENLKNITVQDAFGKKINIKVSLSEDGETAIITPDIPYEKGELYYMTITNVFSVNGKKQNAPIRKLFIVE